MSFHRRVWVAARSAALFLCCVRVALGPAAASDSDDPRIMLFSGRDLWRNGAFAHGGVVIAPAGLDQDGLLLKIVLAGGLYRYDARNLGERVVGTEWLAQVLPGWRIKRGDVELKVFMGSEIQSHHLWPDDGENRLRGLSYGVRVAAEAWYEPSAETMVAADFSLSSIATSNSARAAFGWRTLDDMLGGIYVGPEIQYFGSDGYKHNRLGVHVTSMKTEDTEWSAAAGWARDSAGRSSPYLRLGILKRR